tara:strand:- start:446 stop:769 length:324 start_codon:yes stop_codon:yes gene_type:complete
MEIFFAYNLMTIYYMVTAFKTIKKRRKIVETIKSFMNEHPILSRALIFPFALYITIGITALLFELIIPLLIAVMITNTLYSKAIGKTYKESIYEPYSYVRTRYYTST